MSFLPSNVSPTRPTTIIASTTHGAMASVPRPGLPQANDEFLRTHPPPVRLDAEVSARGLMLQSGQARMQPGLSYIEGKCFDARSAVWFIADDGARIIVVSNEAELAQNLLRGERPKGAVRLFMRAGDSFLERLRGRATGTWHGKLGPYQWQQALPAHEGYRQLPQSGVVTTADTLTDVGSLRGMFAGVSSHCVPEGDVDVRFVGSFCAAPINLSSRAGLRRAIAETARL